MKNQLPHDTAAPGSPNASWGSRVSPTLIKKWSGPVDRPWTSREGPQWPTDLVRGIRWPADHPSATVR